jgi:hypothetical protein
MRQWRRPRLAEYGLIIIGVGLVVIILSAVLGPAVGNAFSNIYLNAPMPPRSLPVSEPATPASAHPAVVSNSLRASPYRDSRLIIKNGEMTLQVADTDRAIEHVTGIALDSGGYVISSRTWQQDNLKYAAVTIGVPSDQFESVQRQLRAIALQVLNDTASGQDVSDEYVDLQSRVTNLEATAARIREFLSQAKDAEQAILVNTKLTEVENELEQIKGRMAYLKDRSAFSTMALNLEPQHPTPAPPPTATAIAWTPDKTFGAAAGALGGVLRGLGDLTIWLGAFVAPLTIPVVIVVAIGMRVRRKTAKPEA